MVPEVRIELTADPYQGSVLPLNYIGVLLHFIICYFLLQYKNMVFETGVEPISSPSEGEILSIELLEQQSYYIILIKKRQVYLLSFLFSFWLF